MTRFIEFYGMPGCGKSTISHQVADRLRAEGVSVSEPTYDVDHRYSSIRRKIHKLSSLVKYALENPAKSNVLKNLVRNAGYRGSSAVSMRAVIANKLLVYTHDSAEYVFLDEGLSQSAVSLADSGSSSLNNEKCLYDLCDAHTVIKVYVRVPVDTVMERMKQRDKHDSRIEGIEDPQLRDRAAKLFDEQCEQLKPSLVLDDMTVDDAVNEVVSFIT